MQSVTWWSSFKRFFRRSRSSSSKAASRVLLSVYLEPKATAPRGLSSASRRILLTTSIWSVVILVIIFFVTYTFLLVSVEHPFQRASGAKELVHGVPGDHARRRLRFHGRDVGGVSSSWRLSFSAHHRKQFWDVAQLHDATSDTAVCRHGSLFIVLITSSPDHFEHRTAIRDTWCNPSLPLQDDIRWQCVFLVGQTNNTIISSRLQEESQQHRDLLRGGYLDSYRNLTHKVMHGMSWVISQCEAPYLLKTDDDCFANTVLLQQFLLHHNTQTSKLYAGGMVVKKEKRKVIRRPNEKWSVSPEDYLPDYYPMYASGSGYILSIDLIAKAVEESKYVKPIPNEDAYIGILMDRLGVAPKLSGRFTLSSSGLRVCNFLYIFVAHGVGPPVHRDMCSKMLKAQKQCWNKDDSSDW